MAWPTAEPAGSTDDDATDDARSSNDGRAGRVSRRAFGTDASQHHVNARTRCGVTWPSNSILAASTAPDQHCSDYSE